MAASRGSQVLAWQFTDFNLHLYGLCRARHGGLYDCAYGRDEAMLGGLATGAVSSIGNGFCYMANVYHRLREGASNVADCIRLICVLLLMVLTD